jgi:cytochrome b561
VHISDSTARFNSTNIRGALAFAIEYLIFCIRTLYCKAIAPNKAIVGTARSLTVTADDDRSPHLSSAAPLHAHFALLVLVVGLLGLIADAWTIPLPHRGNLHILFGVLLWAYVAARFYGRLRRSPRMQPADIRAFSRHLSRLVYLLMYFLAFFNLAIAFLRAAPHSTFLARAENFQIYLVCGLGALITIRVLAARCHHSVIHGVRSPTQGLTKRAAKVA